MIRAGARTTEAGWSGRARALVRPAGLVAALLLVAACGDRMRYEDTILVPMTVSGARATKALEESLSPDLLARLGGGIPAEWPEGLPDVARDLPLEIPIDVKRPDLGRVGEDLAAVDTGEAELRIRAIDVAFDPGSLTPPVVAGTLFAAPADATSAEVDGAREVGILTGFEGGTGEVVFTPGGRRALQARLTEDRLTLVVVLTVAFDTRVSTARPGGEGDLSLRMHADILR